MHHNLSKDVPKFDIELLFNEIGVLLDDNQYRDTISLVDMYHFYTRRHQVCVCSLFPLIAVGADPFPLKRTSHLISFHLVPFRSARVPPVTVPLPVSHLNLDANTRIFCNRPSR